MTVSVHYSEIHWWMLALRAHALEHTHLLGTNAFFLITVAYAHLIRKMGTCPFSRVIHPHKLHFKDFK